MKRKIQKLSANSAAKDSERGGEVVPMATLVLWL